MREGWEEKKLKDVGKIFSGNSINAKVKEQKYTGLESGVPYVATKDVSYDSLINYNNGIKIPLSEVSNFRVADENSVLICAEGGSAGRKIGILNQRVCFVNKLFALTPNEMALGKYVFYWYKSDSFQSEFKDGLTGIIGGVSKTKFQGLSIPIPPLPEQKQIVELLDKAFEAIDQAKANIEKNIQNAKELFDSKKEELFERLSTEFEVKSLTEACDKIFAGGDAPKENFSINETEEFNIPIIANAVKKNGLYGYTNEARVLKPSITVAARGSGTGHTEYRDYPFFPIVRLIVLTPNTEIINVEYLMYSIKNLVIKRSGSAIPQLTVPMIKTYSIPFPSMNQQISIVESMNAIQFTIEGYRTKLLDKLNNLEELKKSILQKAFAGELTKKKN